MKEVIRYRFASECICNSGRLFRFGRSTVEVLCPDRSGSKALDGQICHL